MDELLLFNNYESLSEYRQELLSIAVATLGMPSVKFTKSELGLTTDGFDCSGWGLYVIKKAREKLPDLILPQGVRKASQMFDNLGVLIHASAALPADFVFYSKDGVRPWHIAMFLGRDESGNKLIIHSPGKFDHQVEVRKMNYYGSVRLKGGNGNIYTHNPIGFKRLTVQANNVSTSQLPIP